MRRDQGGKGAAARAPRRVSEGVAVLRLGVFGGTFDPPHIGHLAVAEEARDRLGLDRVLFVPAREPPHKPVGAASPPLARLALVRAAVAGHPAFAVSELELHRSGPSYTADTLAEIGRSQPDAELFCLIGGDTAVQLHTWHDLPRLHALATFVALLRPGWPRDRIEAWRAGQPPALRLVVLEVPGLDISASGLRERVAGGRSIRYLVPDGVRRVIAEQGLYGGEVRADDGA